VFQRFVGSAVREQRLPQEQTGRRGARPQRERALDDLRRRLGLATLSQRGALGQPVLQLERIQLDGAAEQPHALVRRIDLSSPSAELRRQLQPPLRIGRGRVHLRLQPRCARRTSGAMAGLAGAPRRRHTGRVVIRQRRIQQRERLTAWPRYAARHVRIGDASSAVQLVTELEDLVPGQLETGGPRAAVAAGRVLFQRMRRRIPSVEVTQQVDRAHVIRQLQSEVHHDLITR